jgi:hypothetical protein
VLIVAMLWESVSASSAVTVWGWVTVLDPADYSATASVQQRDGSPEYFSQFEARTCRRNHWFDPKIQQTPRISLVAQILLGVVLGFSWPCHNFCNYF